MASKRDVLFATQYYGTYDCSKCVHVLFKHLLVLRGNPVWQGKFPFVFEHFGLWQCLLRVPTGDTAFSNDAQVLHLSQWLFLAFGMELLLETFSVLEHLMDYYASQNICKNLPFVKDYIQATYTFPTMKAGTQASWYACLFP